MERSRHAPTARAAIGPVSTSKVVGIDSKRQRLFFNTSSRILTWQILSACRATELNQNLVTLLKDLKRSVTDDEKLRIDDFLNRVRHDGIEAPLHTTSPLIRRRSRMTLPMPLLNWIYHNPRFPTRQKERLLYRLILVPTATRMLWTQIYFMTRRHYRPASWGKALRFSGCGI
jgi:hypothetical protein